MRAIVPSSFITSQITPAGKSPARRREIDGGLGVACADEHPALARLQREDVARLLEVVRASRRDR